MQVPLEKEFKFGSLPEKEHHKIINYTEIHTSQF